VAQLGLLAQLLLFIEGDLRLGKPVSEFVAPLLQLLYLTI